MKKILEKLFNHLTLSEDEAYEIIKDIAEEKFNDFELTAFITVYNLRKISLDELKGFRKALLELAIPVDLPEDAIDIVGTGGDGKDTFNISTLACFIVAGSGRKVIKHGSYSSSSVSGSSDMLEKFGYKFSTNSNVLNKYLNETNICFLHAPLFHPIMKHVVEIRKSLKVKTFFNIMGPLINPATPNFQCLGTFNSEISRLYYYLLKDGNTQFGIINSIDGYDEVSLTNDVQYYSNYGEKLLEPLDFGYNKIYQKDIQGGNNKEDNANIFINILKGKGTEAQNNVVCANAGLAINIMEKNKSLLDCVEIAKDSLLNGNALNCFNELMTLCKNN